MNYGGKMNPIDNPFTPGAGRRPPYLAGRDSEIAEATTILARLKAQQLEKSIAIYGLRGVGKTVLLNEFKKIADSNGIISEHIEVIEAEDFKRLISRIVRKLIIKISSSENLKEKGKTALRALKSFTLTIPDGPEFSIDVDTLIGVADSGNLTQDLIDLFISLGEAAKDHNKQVCIFIDEVQYLKNDDFSALLSAIHRLNQLELPVLLMVAGLPQIAGLAGEAKSYAERLFHYIRIDSLSAQKAKDAVKIPVENLGVEISANAIDAILMHTGRYPFYLQAFAKVIWDEAENPISETHVSNSYNKFIQSLDEGFFKVRIDRTTGAEKKMLKSMAAIGKGPYSMTEVASKYGSQMRSISPHRSSLMKKGLIYSPDYNKIDFTVPLFDDFIRRELKD
jgi:Cdc6-like AAA superfamily ATPase